jgi:Domain of unknown function (DUF4390)
MMVFMMPFLKNRLLKSLFVFFCALLCVSIVWAQAGVVEIANLKVNRLSKDIAVSAEIKFDLPSSIEEAMYKGVSLTFVSDVEISKERWYWVDKKVTVASRQTRISYQALTRRWRVQPWTDTATSSGLGVQLPQTYETLTEALAVAQRIYNWRVAPASDLDDGNYSVQLSYRLDMSQLPKPLQIGLLGRGDWSINVVQRQRMTLLGVTP